MDRYQVRGPHRVGVAEVEWTVVDTQDDDNVVDILPDRIKARESARELNGGELNAGD